MRSTRTILAGTVAGIALMTGAAIAQPGGNGNGNGGGNAAHGNAGNKGGGQQAKGNAGNKGGGQQAKGNGNAGNKGSGQQAKGNGNAGNKGGGQQAKGNGNAGNKGGGQQGKGNGNAGNKGGGQQAKGNGNAGNNGGGQQAKGNGNSKQAGNQVRQQDRSIVAHRPARSDIKQTSYNGPKGNTIVVPTNDRVRVVTNGTPVKWSRIDARPSYDGCPPGLAKKYNGCTPPGLARTPTRSWSRPDWYWRDYNTSYNYRYTDGYMVRLGSGNSILSYIPLLAGALAIGNTWPGSYSSVALPDYYNTYYDLGSANSYRYYGDTIYRVDPGSSQINSIAALMMGNDIAIGQPMPMGYDVYNVPYDYRDQYYDTPDAYYRYSDGYIYQLDPTTRLVQAAIELLV